MKYIFYLSLVVLLFTCIEKKQYISYSEFGAAGDGITDDFDAIIKAHDAANKTGIPVKANSGATYYIGGADKTAQIQTDTDWGDAKFIIDDKHVENSRRNIFSVETKLPVSEIKTVKTLKKNQIKLDLSLEYASVMIATDTFTMRYIREGLNQNKGTPQIDVFVVDKNGNVDLKAPIIWDYNNISRLTAYPIDDEQLTIKGGYFTTIANQGKPGATYYARGIGIRRSKVVIDKVYHIITNELDQGSPYEGFINIARCTEVTVQNCKLSGHKVYWAIGSANVPVKQGTYDTNVSSSTNVTYKNCKQVNDIHDKNLWGIFTSNYSKNLTLNNVEFSRFDAHMGVSNATIKNSIIGHQGINIIGSGIFLMENSKVFGWNFMNLREDYGSTFEGEIIIRNCEYNPLNGEKSDVFLITGSYSGMHDFGYKCFLPRKITIDGLIINDNNTIERYQGPKIFACFNPLYNNDSFVEKYPYTITEEVIISNLTIKSGKPLIVSNNPFMFRNVQITKL